MSEPNPDARILQRAASCKPGRDFCLGGDFRVESACTFLPQSETSRKTGRIGHAFTNQR